MAGASTVAGRGPYGASASGPSSFQPVFLSQTVAHNYRNPEDQDHNPHNFKLDEDKREYFSFVFSQVAAGSYRTGYLPLTAVQNMDKIKGGDIGGGVGDTVLAVPVLLLLMLIRRYRYMLSVDTSHCLVCHDSISCGTGNSLGRL